ncbi:hypothetical protein HQQ81_07925 [Microbacteriaceae bacterium VKM Ac-2854]|nr:hypothetical protein [Microbacteriaceae bacterium VKM Ac-2854]
MLLGDSVIDTHVMTVAVLAIPFTVRFDERITADDVERIRGSWRRCLLGGESAAGIGVDALLSDSVFESAADSLRVVGSTLAHLEELLTSSLTVRAIGEQQNALLMLHACGLASPDGRVLALVAASGTGKTTAARTLGRSYGYVTDETVAIDAEGGVVAYPKPLSVKQDEAGLPKRQLAPDAAELLPVPDAPLSFAAVALLDRADGVVEARIESVDPIDAICELVPQTSYLSVRDRPLLELLTTFEARGGVHRLVYSEAESLPPLVARLLELSAAPAAPGGYEPLPRHELDRAQTPEPEIPAVRRAAVQDAIAGAEGDLLLFVSGSVVRLSGIGPLIWDIARDWIGIDAVLQSVLDAIGHPPDGVDAESVVRATLYELAAAGVVELSESVPAAQSVATA